MKKNNVIQHFSAERLSADRAMSKDQIAQFVHEFQQVVHGNEGKKKLISIRVPETLLSHFRAKAKMEKCLYQTKILDLMRRWIANPY